MHMTMATPAKNLYPPADADRIAAEMQAEDDEWRYVAVHDPKGTGYSYIEIFDETGASVGTI